MERCALLEIDRERTTAAKRRKKAEAERAEHAEAIERVRIEQKATQAPIGQLREQVGAFQNSVETLANERDRERAELQSVRKQIKAAIRQAAADSARANLLRGRVGEAPSQNYDASRAIHSAQRKQTAGQRSRRKQWINRSTFPAPLEFWIAGRCLGACDGTGNPLD